MKKKRELGTVLYIHIYIHRYEEVVRPIFGVEVNWGGCIMNGVMDELENEVEDGDRDDC